MDEVKDRICNALIVLAMLALVGAGFREYLIHNGRLTSDMNADGHSITNLPDGFFPTNGFLRAHQDISGKADKVDTYTKVEVDSRIVELAPAPGDYANVSNLAVGARSYADLSTDTNRWLVVRPDGGAEWMTRDPENDWAWFVDDLVLVWEGTAWSCVKGAFPPVVLYGGYGAGLDATSLTFTGGGQTYSFFRGRLALVSELPPVPDLSSYATQGDVSAAATSATNYADKVAGEFEDGMRTAQYANNSGHADYAVQLYGDGAPDLYNATDLIVASTNAAEAVAAPLRQDISDLRTESSLVYRLYQGSNVVAEVTNYNSQVNAPELKIMQLNESNEYITVWAETNGLARTLARAREYADGATNALRDVYAPRAWSRTSSGLGSDVPDGMTWVSTEKFVIAGGLEFEKHVTSGGAIWLLESNGMAADFHATSNNAAFLDISAGDGTSIFRIEKTDSFLVGVNVDSVSVDGSTLVCGVGVVAAEHPLVRVKAQLTDASWSKEEDGTTSGGVTTLSGLATVEWSGGTGNWTCRITNLTGGNSLFAQMEYLQEGGTKIVNTAPIDVTPGILCTDGIHKVRPVYNNGNITWEVVP